MDENFFVSRIMIWIPLVFSLTVHEWAHAASAALLGDRTAEQQGRLTLNPLPHLDPVGTVLLPLIGVPFGWAKPVPVNPARFRRGVNMRTGLVLTAAAGPASNVVLAFVSSLALAMLYTRAPHLLATAGPVLQMMVFLNVLLAVFNMLPIPPLDGSRVADGLMPNAWRPAWDAFARLGPLVLAGVILAPLLFGFSLFSWPLALTQEWIYLLAGWLAA